MIALKILRHEKILEKIYFYIIQNWCQLLCHGVNFNVYYGSTGDKPEHGLTMDVALQLVDPGLRLSLGAGYQLCVDNYYTSRVL